MPPPPTAPQTCLLHCMCVWNCEILTDMQPDPGLLHRLQLQRHTAPLC